jgi:hypothetical protein
VRGLLEELVPAEEWGRVFTLLRYADENGLLDSERYADMNDQVRAAALRSALRAVAHMTGPGDLEDIVDEAERCLTEGAAEETATGR